MTDEELASWTKGVCEAAEKSGQRVYRPFVSDEELDQLVVDQERAREEPESAWVNRMAEELAGTPCD